MAIKIAKAKAIDNVNLLSGYFKTLPGNFIERYINKIERINVHLTIVLVIRTQL